MLSGCDLQAGGCRLACALASLQKGIKNKGGKTDTQVHFLCKVVTPLQQNQRNNLVLPFFPFVNPDDDIHLLVTVKGFILPQFYCMKTHHCHNQMPIITLT